MEDVIMEVPMARVDSRYGRTTETLHDPPVSGIEAGQGYRVVDRYEQRSVALPMERYNSNSLGRRCRLANNGGS